MRVALRFLTSPLPWCLLAFVIRFFYLVEQANDSVLFAQPTLDELELAQAAEQLRTGQGFGEEPLFKAPLYPVFLAICMRVAGDAWFWLARLVQHLGGAVLVGLAFDTARRLMPGEENRRGLAGAAAAGLLVFYPPLIRLENRLVMDFLGTLLQSAMVWALVRERTETRENLRLRWLLLAGLFAGLSWLNRPTITPVIPVLGILMAFLPQGEGGISARQKLTRCGAFWLIPFLMMSGVTLRNAAVGGEAMLLPWQGGYNLYHANHPSANGRYYVQDGFASAASGNPTRDLMIQGYRQAVSSGQASPPEEGRLAGAVNDYWMERARGAILEDPAAWLGKMIQKAVYLTSAREIFNFEAFEIHWKSSGLLRWLPLGFGWLWPLALMTLLLPMGRSPAQKQAFWLLWAYLILMGGAIALVYTSGRLRMPLIFPVSVCCALAVITLADWIRTRSVPGPVGKVIGSCALLVLGMAMSWGDWWGVRSEVVAHYDLARLSDAAWRQGRAEEALAYALEAERTTPSYRPLPLLKAQALYSLGQVKAAETEFLKALERLPADPTPAYNLGFIAYYDRMDPASALTYFTMAAGKNPESLDSRLYVAMSQIRLGHLPEARERLQAIREQGPPASLLFRVSWVGLLSREGKKTEAEEAMQQWVVSLPPEMLQQVQEELNLLLKPVNPSSSDSP